MTKDDIKETATQEPKKRGRGRPKGSKDKKPRKKGYRPDYAINPMLGNNAYKAVPKEDMIVVGNINMTLINMQNIDLKDVDQVQARLNEYLYLYISNGYKPTVAGMALALNGHDRRWLWSLVHDAPIGGRRGNNMVNLPPDVTDCIKKTYFSLENQWETYMNSGKINPVAGIFLGKNNYDYVDKAETVLTPNTTPVNDYSPDEIRERYTSSDSQKQLPDTDDSDDTDNE